MNKVIKLLVSLGFIDITNDKPIKFIECFDCGFNNVYDFNVRLKRFKDGVLSEVLIGFPAVSYARNIINVKVNSFYNNCQSTALYCRHIDFYKKEIPRIIENNETYLTRNFK